MTKSDSKRDHLLYSLNGETVCIPNLMKMFADWPGTTTPLVNPCREELTYVVNERLAHLHAVKAIDARALRGLKAADFGLFISLWWPEAEFEQARIIAYFVIWIFTWDDEVDEPSGSYADDMKVAEEFRRKSLDFIKQNLGLVAAKDDSPVMDKHYYHPITRSFQDIGDALRKVYSVEQREYFYHEMLRYIKMTSREQKLRLGHRLPSPAEFWAFRMGTSAVELCLAVAEYSNHTQLPGWVLDLPSMKAIWEETNIIISAANDLYSLKKEVGNGCIDNAVALVCGSGLNMNAAVASVVEQICESKARFEAAALALQQDLDEDLRLSKDAARFVYVCRTHCTGNIIWSLETRRYGLSGKDVLSQNGTLTFKLRTLV